MGVIKVWFTPKQRKAVYTFGYALFAFLLAVGVIAPEQVAKFQDALITAGAIFALGSNFLASSNVNPEE